MSKLEEDPSGRRFEALDEGECLSLIGQTHFGRVGVTVGVVPAIFPVNYYAEDGAVYFFTAQGTKLADATEEPVVSFQIDHFDVTYHEGWSVLAMGKASLVEGTQYRELVARIPLEPWAPGDRCLLIQILPDFLSGRRIRSVAN